MPRHSLRLLRLTLALLVPTLAALASPQNEPPRGEPPPRPEGMPPFGPEGRGPGGGRMPMMGQVRKLVAQHDKDGDKRLDREERDAARAAMRASGAPGMGPRGGRGMPGGRVREAARPGETVVPEEVPIFPGVPLYDPGVVRTLFLEFEQQDWETELADFFHTDVEVPATLTVDRRSYPKVGVRFRGASSFMGVPQGSKRSLNLSLDFVNQKQRLLGCKTVNLLNAHEDPSFLRTVLYLDIARSYLPAPKANLVKLVINGENWGVYVSAQQFNKEFIAENYPSTKGARFKAPGSPQGRAGLEYLGEEIAPYKQRFENASADDDAEWKELIKLCRTLCTTPPEELEQKLSPMLDIDGALRFLALELVLVNNDGYWTRASDYALFQDEKGKFHLIPHDANETFAMNAGGPGGMGGPGGPAGGQRTRGTELDPLIGLEDARKPLRSQLLQVPALRARYLAYVKEIATEWLDWNKLGPIVAKYRATVAADVEADPKKLSSFDAFKRATADEAAAGAAEPGQSSLRAFAERRRAFLLAHEAIK